MLGAGSTVLGDIAVGDGCTVGAAAIVTRAVPDGATVVGVRNEAMLMRLLLDLNKNELGCLTLTKVSFEIIKIFFYVRLAFEK